MVILAQLSSSADRLTLLRGAGDSVEVTFYGALSEVARNIDDKVAGVVIDLHRGSAAEIDAVASQLRRCPAPLMGVTHMDAATVKVALRCARRTPDFRMAVRGFVAQTSVADLFQEN